jgi:eukaryotic-like serine/threonine-protein kinase
MPAEPTLDSSDRQLIEFLGARYRVGKLLGRGGMGAVYRATDTMLDREVAIKVIPPDLARNPDIVSRFEREAKTAARLDHPGIIPIYSVERGQDISLFIMKFVSGRDLDKVMADNPTLPIEVCQRVIWEAACALAHAHSRGVVHRDIKPANIMLDEADRVLVADFGIAKAADGLTQLTSTGMVLGTPQYMSPEQAMGESVTGASDQYSLGMTAYHLLTGAPAFPLTSIHGLIYKHIHEVPRPLKEVRPDVPDAVAAAIMRALAKDPAARFATMEEFATALWPERPVAANGTSSGFSSTYSAVAEAKPAARSGVPKWLIGAGAVVAIGVAALLFKGSGTETEPSSPAATGSTAAEGAAEPTPPTPTPATPSAAEVAATQAGTRALAVPPAPEPRAATPPPVATAPASGFLTVQADPFGTVYVDGVEIQDTPFVRYAVAPGRRIVEIRRVGFRTAVDTVNVATGSNARISKTLIPQ